MNDIVIDTNVLVHINNKNNHFHKSAVASLNIIQNKKIIQGKMNKPHAIAFVIVACGSSNKLLLSNDCDDFTDDIRQYITASFSLSILDSDEYVLAQTKEPSHA
jgi:predicted nucleic acid-binding protein